LRSTSTKDINNRGVPLFLRAYLYYFLRDSLYRASLDEFAGDISAILKTKFIAEHILML